MDDSDSNNSKMQAVEPTAKDRDVWVASALALVTLFVFFFSIKATQKHFDYTARIASALLDGHICLQKPAPTSLNEMVPANGRCYSVFSLSRVVNMLLGALL